MTRPPVCDIIIVDAGTSTIYLLHYILIIAEEYYIVKCLHQFYHFDGGFFMFKKSKFWHGVCFLSDMPSDWQSRIDLLHVPFAYALHDLDHNSKSDHSLDHVHVVLAFPKFITLKYALSVFNLLSSDCSICCPFCYPFPTISPVCKYLICHTDILRFGNGFDSLCQVPTSY